MESCERRVSGKTRDDQITLKVIMYLSGAVAVDEKDRNDVWGDLRILEQRTKAELLRNLVNIMKIKLIGYQVIAKHTGTRKVYFMTMTPNAKIKKKINLLFTHGISFC